MNQVNQLTEGTKVVTVFEMQNGTFLVDYLDPAVGEAGYFLQAGFFTTKEAADARAAELLVAESITGEMLLGDVPTE
jgi:hypothetical protein